MAIATRRVEAGGPETVWEPVGRLQDRQKDFQAARNFEKGLKYAQKPWQRPKTGQEALKRPKIRPGSHHTQAQM